MSKIKNGGLDQYGAGPSEQQQFGTAGVEGVKPDTFLNIAVFVSTLHVDFWMNSDCPGKHVFRLSVVFGTLQV